MVLSLLEWIDNLPEIIFQAFVAGFVIILITVSLILYEGTKGEWRYHQ